MPSLLALENLEQALFWVSSPPEFEAQAFISRTTGRIYSRNSDGPIDDDFPDDIDDATEYLAFPMKGELNLGRNLAVAFIDEFAPQVAHEVREVFHRKGAYGRFKSLLQRHRLLDQWHEYERQATASALCRWAEENGFQVKRGPHDA